MTNELLFQLAGMLAAFAAGVGLMLLAGRRHPAPDPAAEGERELAVVEARDAASAERARNHLLQGELARQQEELARAREHIATLEQQVGSYLRQYAVSKDILRKELLQKNALLAELAAANAQLAALRGRIQELELSQSGSRPRPAPVA